MVDRLVWEEDQYYCPKWHVNFIGRKERLSSLFCRMNLTPDPYLRWT
jgi:hypothetical protein